MHLLTAGTDRANLLLRLTVLAITLVIGAATVARILQPEAPKPARVPMRSATARPEQLV